MRYAVVIEKAEGISSAHMPELSGCVASGATVAEVEAWTREAFAFHFEGMREDGIAVPRPQSQGEYGEVVTSGDVTKGRKGRSRMWPSKDHPIWPQLDVDHALQSRREPESFPLVSRSAEWPSGSRAGRAGYPRVRTSRLPSAAATSAMVK